MADISFAREVVLHCSHETALVVSGKHSTMKGDSRLLSYVCEVPTSEIGGCIRARLRLYLSRANIHPWILLSRLEWGDRLLSFLCRRRRIILQTVGSRILSCIDPIPIELAYSDHRGVFEQVFLNIQLPTHPGVKSAHDFARAMLALPTISARVMLNNPSAGSVSAAVEWILGVSNFNAYTVNECLAFSRALLATLSASQSPLYYFCSIFALFEVHIKHADTFSTPFLSAQDCRFLLPLLKNMKNAHPNSLPQLESRDFNGMYVFEMLSLLIRIGTDCIMCLPDHPISEISTLQIIVYAIRTFNLFYHSYMARLSFYQKVSSTPSGRKRAIYTVLLGLHEIKGVTLRVKCTRVLAKILSLIQKEPSNRYLRRIDIGVNPLLNTITSIPQALAVLFELGFAKQSETILNCSSISTGDLDFVLSGLQSIEYGIWSEFLPPILGLISHYFQALSPRVDLSSKAILECLDKAGFSEDLAIQFFDSLMIIAKNGGDNVIDSAVSDESLKVIASGMTFFFSESHKLVSFLSDLFQTCVGGTNLGETAAQRPSVILFLPPDLLFKLSSLVIEHLYKIIDERPLCKLSYGHNTDPWITILSEEMNEKIVPLRLARILCDSREDTQTLSKYESDPIYSDVLSGFHRIYEQVASQSFPLKMSIIFETLFYLGSQFNHSFSNGDKVGCIQWPSSTCFYAIVLLFQTQRELLGYASSEPTPSPSPESSVHPVLEYGRVLLQRTIAFVSAVPRTSAFSAHLQESFVGPLLFEFLVGIVSLVPVIGESTDSLQVFYDNICHLSTLIEGKLFEDDTVLEDISNDVPVPDNPISEEVLEGILDGGSSVLDFVIDPIFKVKIFPEHDTLDFSGFLEFQQANSRFLELLESCTSRIQKLYSSNRIMVLSSLSRIQEDPFDYNRILQIIRSNSILFDIVRSRVVEGGPIESIEFPDVYQCICCGKVRGSIQSHINHTSFNMCISPKFWLVDLSRLLRLTTVEIACYFAVPTKSDIELASPWLHSELLRGGFILGDKLLEESSSSDWNDDSISCSSSGKDTGYQISPTLSPSPECSECSSSSMGCNVNHGDIPRPFLMDSYWPDQSDFYTELIDGVGIPGALDNSILSLNRFVSSHYRRNVSGPICKATRAIVAVLLRHAGKSNEIIGFAYTRFGLDCTFTSDQYENTYKSPQHSWMADIWEKADSLLPTWVQRHQEGIVMQCSLDHCQLSTKFENDMYTCEAGHETGTCVSKETVSYEGIARDILSKCMFLLQLHVASEFIPVQTLMRRSSTLLSEMLTSQVPDLMLSRNPSVASPVVELNLPDDLHPPARASFRESVITLGGPEYIAGIQSSVVSFMKDEIDPISLKYHLLHSYHQAGYRLRGFRILSELIAKNSGEAIESLIISSLAGMMASWKVPSGQLGPHPLDGIENAGIEMKERVKDAFAVLGGNVVLLTRRACSKFKDTGDSVWSEVIHSLLGFWKFFFRQEDFTLLRSIGIANLATWITATFEYDPLISLAAKNLYNSLAVVGFLAEESPLFIMQPKRYQPESISRRPNLSRASSVFHFEGIDTYQRMFLTDIYNTLSSQIHSETSTDSSQLVDSLSLLILACCPSLSKESKSSPTYQHVIDLICNSSRWASLIMVTLYQCLNNYSSLNSSVVFRRVFSLCQLTLPHMHPDYVSEVYAQVSGDNDTSDDYSGVDFLLMLFREVGYSCSGVYFDVDWVPDMSFDHTCIRVNSIIRLLQTLYASSMWNFSVCQAVSRTLVKLGSVKQDLRQNFKGEHPLGIPWETKEAVYGNLGVFTLLSGSMGSWVPGTRVFQGTESGTITSAVGFSILNVIMDNAGSPLGVPLSKLQYASEALGSETLGMQLDPVALRAFIDFTTTTPIGSSDRRRSSTEGRRSFLTSEQPPFLFAYVHALGIRAFRDFVKNHSADTISSLSGILGPFMRKLVSVAKTPIPLFDASNLDNLELNCVKLARVIHCEYISQIDYYRNHSITSVLVSRLRASTRSHVDLCRKAFAMFGTDLESAISWLTSLDSTMTSIDEEYEFVDESSSRSKAVRTHEQGVQTDSYPKTIEIRQVRDLDAHQLLPQAHKDYPRHHSTSAPATLVHSFDNTSTSEATLESYSSEYFREIGDVDMTTEISSCCLDRYARIALRPEAVGRRVHTAKSAGSLEPVFLPALTKEQMRVGQLVCVSKSWLDSTEQISKSTFKSHIWLLNNASNSWDPLGDDINMELENHFNSGQICCIISLDGDLFMVRLDRMVMYHTDTGYTIRLRRKLFSDHAQQLKRRRILKKAETWNKDQLGALRELQRTFPDVSIHWCIHALSTSAFDVNKSAESILRNTDLMKAQDTISIAHKTRSMVGDEPSSLNMSSFEVEHFKLASVGLSFATIDRINYSSETVDLNFGISDNGEPIVIEAPAAAVDWYDSWIYSELPEISKRQALGIQGLAIDSFVGLGIVCARQCLVSLFGVGASSVSSASSSLLTEWDLPVSDIISTLKLASNDIHGISPWPVLKVLISHPSYTNQVIALLTDDAPIHLKKSQLQIKTWETVHPYETPDLCKYVLEIPTASEILIEFDEGCSIREGQARLSFYSDDNFNSELLVLSGSSYLPENCSEMTDGFGPLLFRSNRVYFSFESLETGNKSLAREFGLRLRARQLALRYDDERDVLRAPLGWGCLALLCCRDSSDVFVRDAFLYSPEANLVIKQMMMYLLDKNSPCKVFVCHCLCEIFFHVSTTAIGTRKFKDELLESLGGDKLFRDIQELQDILLTSHDPVSSFLKAIFDLIRLSSRVFPSTSILTCTIISSDLPGFSQMVLNPFLFPVPFGKNQAVDTARVVHVMEHISSSTPLPSTHFFELAVEFLNETHLMRLSLKELEASIKSNHQKQSWKDTRRDWLTSVNNFRGIELLFEIITTLLDSMIELACYQLNSWKEEFCKSRSIASYAQHLLDLEEVFFHNGEAGPLVVNWSSGRDNWRHSLACIANGSTLAAITSLPDPEIVRTTRWSLGMDEALVLFVDGLVSIQGRRLRSLSCVDVPPPPYPFHLHKMSQLDMRARFAFLKMANQLIAGLVGMFVPLESTSDWSLGYLARRLKRVLFLQAKTAILFQILTPMYTLGDPEKLQCVMLNRLEAARGGVSVFEQLYMQLRAVPSSMLRRRGQSWRVKFIGEGGHDVGGLYNACLTDVCTELMSNRLNVFVPSVNSRHGVGECRDKLVPATPIHNVSWLEFVGVLIGISCLNINRTLALDLPSIVWKSFVREPLTSSDLYMIDYPSWRLLNLFRNPGENGITSDNFLELFPDMYFVVEIESDYSLHASDIDTSFDKMNQVELVAGGSYKEVTFNNRLEYCDLFQEFQLNRYNAQISAIARGIAKIVPFDILSIFTWDQLDVLVCGSPDVDIGLLREKTVYQGRVSETDRHVGYFWEVLESFQLKDRKAFLQFVWGRSRLPSDKVSFGKDFFHICEHASSMQSCKPDDFFPVAHTCFFSLELPRYTSRKCLAQKLIYAIHNCHSIDADTTRESFANLNMNWEEQE